MNKCNVGAWRGDAAIGVVVSLSLLLIVMAMGAAGCKTVESPPQPRAEAKVAPPQPVTMAMIVQRLQARGQDIERFSASGKVTLSREGERITFDGVVVASLPDRFRLRAYKMGSAVFDLTLRPEGLWLWKSARASDVALELPRYRAMPMAIGALLVGGLPPGDFQVVSLDSRMMEAMFNFDGPALIATIDKLTGQVRRYRFTEPTGRSHIVELGDYKRVGSVDWPHDVQVRSDMGVIGLRFDDVELNGELPAGAFDPPTDAVRSE